MRAREFLFENFLNGVLNDPIAEEWEKSNKPYSGMVSKFSQKHSKLGSGAHGTVYSHPTKDTTVIKIFANDRGYAEWLRWILKHQNNKYVPRVIPHEDGSIIKMYKYFKPGISQRIGIVNLEKLLPVSVDEIVEFSRAIVEKYLDEYDQRSILRGELLGRKTYFDRIGPLDWQYIASNSHEYDPDLSELAEFFINQEKTTKIGLDLHDKNLMRRQNGEIVFVDPLVSFGN